MSKLGGLLRRWALRRYPQPTAEEVVDPGVLRLVDEVMERHFEGRVEEAERERLRFDRVRFARSIEWLGRAGLGGRVLELGQRSVATEVLEAAFPECSLDETGFDLRHPFPLPDAAYQAVVAMEVVEHLGDLPYEDGTTFTAINHCLRECRRVLEPGGLLFLTTPNATSLWVIQRALLHQPPWMFELHFREYTVGEITGFVERAGFEVLEVATERVWHFWDFSPIERFLEQEGYSRADRGDDIFMVARRPVEGESP